MNKILSSAVFLFLFTQTVFSQSSWQWLNPKPESNIYHNVNFFDNNLGVAGSNGGTVLITLDGGASWKTSLVKSESVIEDAVFIDSNLILAVTHNANNSGSILISKDFGVNWKNLSYVLRSQKYLAAKFINSTTGFVLTSSGFILTTNDKCVSWTMYPERFDFNLSSEIVFADNNIGFINTTTGIIKTTDGGNIWTPISDAPAGLTSLYFYKNNLHAVSSNKYYSSSNFGQNWNAQELSFPTGAVSKIRAHDNKLFLFFDSKIYRSIDNGGSWASVIMDDGLNFTDGKFVNNRLILSGNGIFSYELQSGAFQPLLNGIRSNIKSGKSFNSNVSFAVGNKGLLMKTTNAGNDWNKITLNTQANLSSICINGNKIRIAGDSGIYLYSINLGTSWTKQYLMSPSGSSDIYSMNFLNENNGVISYEDGNLKLTNDGGQTWFNKTGSFSKGIFKYIKNNIIIGISNQFHKSINNGSSWANYEIDNGKSFSDIIFLNESIGFAAADSGCIYRTVNGGINWTKKVVDDNSTANIRLNKVLFINSQIGYCIGNEGRFYFTINGGDTWVRRQLYTKSNLTDIESISWKTCIIYGENGLVMKNENVTNAETVTIEGNVNYNDNHMPVTSGHVKAVNHDYISGITIVFDSTNINSDGSYILRNVRVDSSYIVAYPNSEVIQDFIPTYHPSSIIWTQAILLNTTSNLENIDIAAHRILPDSGSASISGNVFYTLLSNPVSNVTIAAKLNNNFIKLGYSSQAGSYTLNQLPSGNYKIFFDRLGYNNDSFNVILASQQNIVVNINLNSAVTILTGDVMPADYMLYQNYPNPFNPSTKIEFDIAKTGFVTLVVYDMLGREVSRLLNKELTRGKYAYSWNAINTPSGVYFCKLQTNGFSAVKKMLLIK